MIVSAEENPFEDRVFEKKRKYLFSFEIEIPFFSRRSKIMFW